MSRSVDPYRRDQDPRQPYGQPPYGQQQLAPPRPPARSAEQALTAPTRVPGLGLVLTLLGLLVQVLSMVVLPWVQVGENGASTVSMPEIWQAFAEHGAQGFGGWYVALFSYPLAALGIVLALATVLQSVAAKVIWAGLTLIGLGVLVLRYGLGPFADVAFTDSETLDFSPPQIITAIVAIAAVVVVIFMLRMAVSMFRRVASLLLLSLAGVHVAAVVDLVKATGYEELSIGAFGPALGYLLIAVAAFVGPRKLPGV